MKKWVRSGLVWAGILYIITMVLFPLVDHERFDLEKLLLGLPLWAVVGLMIGYLFERKKGKNKRKIKHDSV
jgi:ABC-type polysaccharide/polyol phosphate export permease